MVSFGWISGPVDLASHPLLLLAAALCSSWILILRPKLKMLPLGFVAFFAALILEYYAIPFSYGVELLFIAPFLEECLKFMLNRSRTLKGGIATGWGFSILENTTYFVLFLNTPLLLVVIAVRSLSDTMMHSFNAGLSSFTYRRKGKIRFGLPAAILIHMGFNLGTVLITSSLLDQVMYLAAVFAAMAALMVLMLKKEKSDNPAILPAAPS